MNRLFDDVAHGAGSAAGVMAKVCARCGGGFACGAQSAEGCWCAALPPVPLQEGVADCLCPACLERAMKRSAGS